MVAFVEDFFAVAVLFAVIVFTVIRVKQNPNKVGRLSRFYGSHTGAAWLVLFMIFNVVWTLLFYRGAKINSDHFPYPADFAFGSQFFATILEPLGETTNERLATIGVLVHVGVILGFLVIVVYSKHLHIFLAPINVAFSRRPNALGPMLPMHSDGKPIDFEDPGEDDIFGRGKVEDFTWKGMLDFATCTECGRCQSQCPAWNTGKPLSPKLLIMSLRDHALREGAVPPQAEAPRPPGGDEAGSPPAVPVEATDFPQSVQDAAARPLVGPTELDDDGHGDRRRRHRPRRAVVVHHLRRVRRAVPGRHRARRPHHRHAPLPGADRVGVPVRAGRSVQEPREQGQPVGHERDVTPRLGDRPAVRGQGRRRPA